MSRCLKDASVFADPFSVEDDSKVSYIFPFVRTQCDNDDKRVCIEMLGRVLIVVECFAKHCAGYADHR